MPSLGFSDVLQRFYEPLTAVNLSLFLFPEITAYCGYLVHIQHCILVYGEEVTLFLLNIVVIILEGRFQMVWAEDWSKDCDTSSRMRWMNRTFVGLTSFESVWAIKRADTGTFTVIPICFLAIRVYYILSYSFPPHCDRRIHPYIHPFAREHEMWFGCLSVTRYNVEHTWVAKIISSFFQLFVSLCQYQRCPK